MKIRDGSINSRPASETLLDLLDEILVACPRCTACARVVPVGPESSSDITAGPFESRRLVCSSCGLVRQTPVTALRFDGDADPVRDPYFGEPLWLQIPCRGHILWAYNSRHLLILTRYVEARLRPRPRDASGNWSNQAVVNRLPEWMITSGSRADVLRAVTRLRKEKGIGNN